MSQQNFEQHLRDELGAYPSPLDTAALWAAISPKLAEARRRRLLLWWWRLGLGSLLLLILSCAAMNWLTVPTAPQAANKPQVVSSNQESPAQLQTSEEITSRRNTLHLLQNNSREADNSAASSVPSPSALLNTKRPETQAKGHERGSIRPSHLDARLSAATVAAASQSAPSKPPASPLPGKGALAAPPLPDSFAKRPLLPALALIPALPFEQPEPIAELGKALPPPMPPRTKALSWLLRPEASLGLPFKRLTAKGPEVDGYRQARLDSEQPLDYFQAGLMGGLRHRSGWYALTGLCYTRITERFAFEGTWTELDTLPNGILEIQIDAAGDSSLLRGELPILRSTTAKRRIYNTLQLLDLPLMVGFERRWGRWGAALEGGLLLNLSLKAQGEILAEDGRLLNLAEAPVFRPRLGLSYQAALQLSYELWPNTRLYAAPSLRILPANTTTEGYGLEQAYRLLGLQAGVSLAIGGN